MRYPKLNGFPTACRTGLRRFSAVGGSLGRVLVAPKGSHVGVVPALGELIGVRQVEFCAWPDVVDIPLACPHTMVLPCHARLELRFQVLAEFFHGAAQDGGEFLVPEWPATVYKPEHL